jgi:Kef-type K+ transport system membrane component KefB
LRDSGIESIDIISLHGNLPFGIIIVNYIFTIGNKTIQNSISILGKVFFAFLASLEIDFSKFK